MALIRNPVEWTGAQIAYLSQAFASAGRSLGHIGETARSPAPEVRRISPGDLRQALAKGLEDFGAYRTDVIFLCAVYPIVGLILARLVMGLHMMELLLPLASGFALVGPFAAVGLYEMSRRRERGDEVRWTNALSVFRSPALGAILVLGLMLTVILVLWLVAAWAIFRATLGPAEPASYSAFANAALTTGAGWTMILGGIAAGAVFAVVAMTISVVSFPLLLDRDVGLDTAILTSIRTVRANPGPMLLWGLIVTAGLVIGSIPLLVGLAVVLPVLGHATWHLYRRLVP